MTKIKKGFNMIDCDAVYEHEGGLVAVDDQDKEIVTVELKHLISIHIGGNGKLLINFDTENI